LYSNKTSLESNTYQPLLSPEPSVIWRFAIPIPISNKKDIFTVEKCVEPYFILRFLVLFNHELIFPVVPITDRLIETYPSI
jgi:hypothetical protein